MWEARRCTVAPNRTIPQKACFICPGPVKAQLTADYSNLLSTDLTHVRFRLIQTLERAEPHLSSHFGRFCGDAAIPSIPPCRHRTTNWPKPHYSTPLHTTLHATLHGPSLVLATSAMKILDLEIASSPSHAGNVTNIRRCRTPTVSLLVTGRSPWRELPVKRWDWTGNHSCRSERLYDHALPQVI